MRTISILGAVAVVILALLALFWVRLGSGGNGAVSAEGAPMCPAEESAALKGVSDSAAAGSPVSAGAQRVEVESSAAPTEQTCRIRVVLASSGAAVPDARVWLEREEVDRKGPAWTELMRRFNDVEPVLQSGFGQELALDSRGEVRVPRPARRLELAAARGELHGAATLGPDDATCTVELKAYHALACEVVDRAGHPVEGAQVALYWGDFDPLEHSWTWITGADGQVSIPRLEEQLWPDGYQGPLRLSLAAGVAGEPEIVVFSTDSVPAEPVRFVAGDCARLVVQLTDPQGNELALAGYVQVEIGWESIFDMSLAMRGGASLHLPLFDGRAEFECIGLGLPLEISVGAEGHENVWREVPGPTTPGEELRVLIPVGERSLSARGRVRGVSASFGDRKPTGARLNGFYEQYRAASFSPWVLEGEAFESPIRNARVRWKLDGLWILELSHDGGPVLSTTAVPTSADEGAVLDFGELVFEPQPELARLLVTDDSGAPVEDAQIEVTSGSDTKTVSCDKRGRYLLAGQITELPLSVRATHEHWLASEQRQVVTPGSEFTLALRRAATLAGQLLLPPACNSDDVGLVLRLEPDPAFPKGASYSQEYVEAGRFRFQGCQPGLASLSVYLADDGVFERRGIELHPGRTTELEPIDLRSTLHSFELAFELASGEPWNGGHLEVCEPNGELSSTWALIGPSARARFIAPRPSVDLWVSARRARPVLFENVRDGDRLALPSAPSVVLRIPQEIHRPEPPLALMVRGSRRLPEDVPFEGDYEDVEDCVVGADGSAELRVPWPGDYELVWFVRHTGTGVEFPIERAEPQTIQVPESPASPVVEAVLTSAEVAEAVLAAGG